MYSELLEIRKAVIKASIEYIYIYIYIICAYLVKYILLGDHVFFSFFERYF